MISANDAAISAQHLEIVLVLNNETFRLGGKSMQRRPIGQYLIEGKRLSHVQLEKALQIQAARKGDRHPPFIGMILVWMGAIKEHDITIALAEQQRDRSRMRG